MSATNLHELSDRDLLTSTRAAVGKERAALALVLRHLAEVEHRQLYAASHSSFFEYLTKGLRYSESAAQRRISATRLLREFPWIEAKIQAGALSLSNLSQASTFFRLEKKRGTPLPTEKKAEVLHALEGKSARDGLRYLLSQSSDPEKLKAKRKSSTRPTADGGTTIRFTADAELMILLRRVADLLAHVCPDQDWADIVHRMALITLDKIDPLKKAERARSRRETREKKTSRSSADGKACSQRSPNSGPQLAGSFGTATTDATADTTADTSVGTDTTADTQVREHDIDPDSGEVQIRFPLLTEVSGERSRSTRAEIQHAVVHRDYRGGCTFILSSGERCGSHHGLESDHELEFALGGETSLSNLTLRCRVHNSYRARKTFGSDFITRKVRKRRTERLASRSR